MLTVVAALALASCSSDDSDSGSTSTTGDGHGEATVHDIDGDTTLQADTGSTFTLSLEANPTTGYNWTETVDGDAVRSEGGEYVPPDEAVPGRGGHQLYTYEAVEAGTATIELTYSQAGSGDVGEQYTVTVEVS